MSARSLPAVRVSAWVAVAFLSSAVAFALMIALGAERCRRYAANSFDLGIFQQAVWLIGHGFAPFVTVRGLPILGDHWTPILYPLALLEILWPTPLFLVVAQALALCLGAWPLYRIAYRRTESGAVAAAAVVSYLAHPSLWGMGMFDFHPATLAVLPLLAAVDALDADRPIPFCGWCLGALLTKEDIALAIFTLGLLAVFWKRWRAGALVAGSAIVWLFLALKLMAHLAGAHSSSYWSLYGSTLGQIHRGPIVFLISIFDKLTAPIGVSYLLELIAPTGFLALATPELIVAAAPALLTNLLSERFIMQQVGFQYDAAPLALFYAAAAVGVGRIVKNAGSTDARVHARKTVALGLLAGALLSILLYTPDTVRRYFAEEATPSLSAARTRLLTTIHANASVMATNRLVPHLSNRRRIYLFPNPAQRAVWGAGPEALAQQFGEQFTPLSTSQFRRRLSSIDVQFVALPVKPTGQWPLREDRYQDYLAAVLTCPRYGLVASGGDVLLLQRGAPFLPGLQRAGVPVNAGDLPGVIEKAVRLRWNAAPPKRMTWP